MYPAGTEEVAVVDVAVVLAVVVALGVDVAVVEGTLVSVDVEVAADAVEELVSVVGGSIVSVGTEGSVGEDACPLIVF